MKKVLIPIVAVLLISFAAIAANEPNDSAKSKIVVGATLRILLT